MGTTILATFIGIAVAMICYMTLWFFIALYTKRIDIIDAAWGLGFIYVAFLALFIDGRFEPLQFLTVAFVTIWGLRLFLHIFTRFLKSPEDRRYILFRTKYGKQFWSKAYINIFLLQGLLLLLISTATVAIITSHRTVHDVIAVFGFVLWGFGIAFEATADYQLRKFAAKNKGKIMDKGLWRYSRHPNYFGEIIVWLGAGIVAGSAGAWWGLIGFVVITFLITKVSGIPPIERARAEDKTYQAYKQRTSVLIPLPPKS